MRTLGTLVFGLIIILVEVYLGVKTFYPEATAIQSDIVDEIIEDKKGIVDKLSQAELEFLAENPVVVVGADPFFYPIETFDERGQYTGLAGDYLRLISHLTGMNFEISRQGDWASVEEMAQLKRVDLFMAIAKTNRRGEFMSFTEAYINLPGTIMMTRGQKIAGIEDLYGKKVAVVKGYSWHDFLVDNHAAIEVIPARDTIEAIHLVSSGEADAVVDYEFNLREKIQLSGNLQLENVGNVEMENGHAMAVRKDLPELYSIINYAVAEIDAEEKEALAKKWLGVSTRQTAKDKSLEWYIFFFTQAILIVICVMVWANSRVRAMAIAKDQENHA